MQLLTLNTHSLIEENYEQKLLDFVDFVEMQRPDIMALQEVNQSRDQQVAGDAVAYGFVPCGGGIPVRADNHLYRVSRLLQERGMDYHWTWLGMKKSYDRYEEGLGMLSRSNILETNVACISRTDDYENWKTRKILGIRTKDQPKTWFYSVHMGWWQDEEDPFRHQWRRLEEQLKKEQHLWLMGDFNSPAHVTGQGYTMMERSGWYDSFTLAQCKDDGVTVEGAIDGWREQSCGTCGMRIDQIWCNKEVPVYSSRVVLRGEEEPVVSDHYGLLVEC